MSMLYERGEPVSYASQAKRDFAAPPPGRHRPGVVFTMEVSNDIGSRTARSEAADAKAELARAHWRVAHGPVAAAQPSATASAYARRDGLEPATTRGPGARAERSRRDRDGRGAAACVRPGGGATAARSSHSDAFAPATAAERAGAVPRRALTVYEANDIGTRAVRRTLGPDEIQRSHLPQPRYVPEARAEGRPGPEGGVPAGTRVTYPHLGHCIVTGRRRVVAHRTTYEASSLHDRKRPGKHSRDVRATERYNIITGEPAGTGR